MDITRRLFLWLSRVALQLLIGVWLSVTIFTLIFGTPEPLRDSLKKANFYSRLPDIVLSQSKQLVADAAYANGEKETVLAVTKEAFPANKIEGYVTNFSDGFYNWLSGKTARPDYRIDISGERAQIAQGVADRAATRLASLPPCTPASRLSVDPFTIECLPPGIDVGREKQRIINEVLASTDFLPSTIITADQLPKDQSGRSFEEQYKDAPRFFQIANQLPWTLGVATLLTAAVVIALHKEKRRGLRNVARLVLANGSFVFATTLFFGVLLPKLFPETQIRFQAGEASPFLGDVVRQLTQLIVFATLKVSGALIVLGGVVLLAERFINPIKPEVIATPGTEAQPEVLNTAELETKKTTEDSTKADPPGSLVK